MNVVITLGLRDVSCTHSSWLAKQHTAEGHTNLPHVAFWAGHLRLDTDLWRTMVHSFVVRDFLAIGLGWTKLHLQLLAQDIDRLRRAIARERITLAMLPLQQLYVTLGVDQDVLWADVAMGEAFFVQGA